MTHGSPPARERAIWRSTSIAVGVLLAEHAVLLAQEVDDLELSGVDPSRHPEDQESHSLDAHRGDIVARPVIHMICEEQ
jgi:hypothetical protein